MPYTVHSIGRTVEEQQELRVWMPWMRTLALENLNADRQYGDDMLVADVRAGNMLKQLASEAETMRHSDCAGCREFAGRYLYPAHNAPLSGHPNHCTCGGCW